MRLHSIRITIAAALCAFAAAASAQAWPTRPVTIVVPFPAGGTTDVLARAVSQQLSHAIGQPVIVENKPGAGATLGAAYVARANDGGYTLLMGAVHHTVATSYYKHLPYDFEKDFAPITTVATVPNVLVVRANTPYRTVADLVAAAKAKPGAMSFGSNGAGTAQHMIGTEFQIETGTKLLHVPYKGSAPLATALLGGEVDMSFDTVTPELPFIQSGKLRPLAVTTARRSSVLPGVPTLQEAGLPNLAIGTWFGLLAPAATPKDVVARLNSEVVKIIHTPEFRKKMAAIGAEPVGDTQEEMAQQIRAETVKFAALMKTAHVGQE